MFINKLYGRIIGILLFVAMSTLAASQEASPIVFSGFGFWAQDSISATPKLKHVWLIADKQLGDSLELRAFLAFQGPPRIVHTLFVKWRNLLPMVEYVRVGKFEPPFGHGINYYRIDRNPTINYSAIDLPVVARAHGLEVANKWQDFRIKLAAMSGERLLGNIPVAYENSWDVYLRPSYKVLNNLSCGMSRRFGPVPAQGLDMQFELSQIHLETERVSSCDTANYTTLITYQVLPWFKPLVRYEHILWHDQWTLGVSLKLPKDAEMKANVIWVSGKTPVMMGQLVIRW